MQILDLSTYLINNFDNISPLKLQKLLFYIKAWSIVAEKDILSAPFLKWKLGPVNEEIYHKYKIFGGDIIPQQKMNFIPSKEKELIDFILKCYSPFSAISLSEMTHSEKPWIDAKEGDVINDASIKSFYSSQPFAKNFPLAANNTFYPVVSSFSSAFSFDFSAKGLHLHPQSFTSHKDYQKLLDSAQDELSIFIKRKLSHPV